MVTFVWSDRQAYYPTEPILLFQGAVNSLPSPWSFIADGLITVYNDICKRSASFIIFMLDLWLDIRSLCCSVYRSLSRCTR